MQKIKRSRGIYTHRRRQRHPFRVILLVAGAALLVFVGWSIADPLMQFFRGGPASSSSGTSVAQSSKSSSSSGASSSAASSGASSSQPAQQGDVIRGIYLSKSALSDKSALSSAVAAAKSAGLNTVVVQLKGEDGLVNYASKTASAISGGLVAPGAPDGSAAADTIKAAGLTPAAEITCFLDPTGSNVMRDAAVQYSGNHSVRWKDPLGQFWLNPYSLRAQQYLASLAAETVSLGYKLVILDDVTFPQVSGSGSYFGSSTVSRDVQLRAFVTTAQQQVSAAGGKLVVRFPTTASIGAANALTGQNGNMYLSPGDLVAPGFMPGELDKGAVKIGSRTILSPDLTPADTVSAVATYAAAQLASGGYSKVLPFIQAYTNTALGKGFYKTYAAADISGEIASAKAAGFENFILYNPQGSYDLSSLSLK